MVIEPRKVEPGFVKRWSKQALELMERSFHLWFGIAVVLSLAAWAGDRVFFGVSLALGTLLFAISAEIAVISDNDHFDIGDIPDIVAAAWQQALHELWTHRVGVILFVIAIPVVVLALAAGVDPAKEPPPPPPPVTYGDPFVWLFSNSSPFSSAAWAAFIVANLYGYTKWGLNGMRYHLRRTFDLSEEAADILAEKAAQKNREVAAGFPLVMMSSLAVALIFLPILAPFVLCFVPALNYVAFREIFLDDKGNRQPARKTATKLATHGAAS